MSFFDYALGQDNYIQFLIITATLMLLIVPLASKIYSSAIAREENNGWTLDTKTRWNRYVEWYCIWVTLALFLFGGWFCAYYENNELLILIIKIIAHGVCYLGAAIETSITVKGLATVIHPIKSNGNPMQYTETALYLTLSILFAILPIFINFCMRPYYRTSFNSTNFKLGCVLVALITIAEVFHQVSEYRTKIEKLDK